MTPYLIKKGSMRSGLRFGPLFFSNGVRVEFAFDKSALYDPEALQIDQVNKLVGFAAVGFRELWGSFRSLFEPGPFIPPHHISSHRIGWACNPEHPGKIELFTYEYDDYGREYESIGFVSPGERTVFELRLWNWFFFGYTLYPYFGGQKPAPQDVLINLGIKSC